MFAQSGWLLTVLLSWLSAGGGQGGVPAGAAGGPCAAGDWGYITSDPAVAIHVRDNGDDVTGDGSEGLPFASLQRAVDEARLRPLDERKIAVGPGTYDTNLTLDDLADDGLVLQGCGPLETVLDGGNGAPTGAPVLDLANNGDFTVSGFLLEDGTDALTIRGGAMAAVDHVVVYHADDRGIVVKDLATMAWFDDVSVDKTKKGAACGWGVDVTDAMVFWQGGSVTDSRALGVFADRADLILDSVLVRDVNPHTDGTLGRGLHAQDSWTLLLQDTFDKNYDASVFLLQPLGAVIS